jgi:RNA polymerase sigma-70 factor (ECF subfamily)
LDLTDVFRKHQREIYTYFLRLTGDAVDAEELSQETFVRACSAALRFRGTSSVRTWLFAIARRVWLERLRKGSPTQSLTAMEHPVEAAVDVPERLHLLNTLASLEPNDREIVILVEVLGFTPAEAAQVSELSPEAARVRLHRARRRFRERFDT